jgi:hypothetical protein
MNGDKVPARAGLFPLGLFLLIVIGALLGHHEAAPAMQFEADPAAGTIAEQA